MNGLKENFGSEPFMNKTEKPALHLHILGICGTFMGGLALIAKQLGYQVSGSDQNVYPPMSTQLEQQGITLMSGYKASNLEPAPDLVVIGNALSRGNPEVEAVLTKGLHYISGPQWLFEHVLKDKWVLAVAGTHGKTTTSSMLSWILEKQGFDPGFLIGGVPLNFSVSARLGSSDFFVIEADEYDSAFFDKRSKFVHYRPRTLILNNLEFDHADIFDDLDAIKKQFHHLIRMVPADGLIIYPDQENHIKDVLESGCWSQCTETAIADKETDWNAEIINADGSHFEVLHQKQPLGQVEWSLLGRHNIYNALAAIAAARHVGITPDAAIQALSAFKNVKRRLEIIAENERVTVYDDFAHHPTAIQTTLEGLRKKAGTAFIVAILEPRSNTMRMGVHKDTLADSLQLADLAIVYQPGNLEWNMDALKSKHPQIQVTDNQDDIIETVTQLKQNKLHVLFMSNGSFNGLHQKMTHALNLS